MDWPKQSLRGPVIVTILLHASLTAFYICKHHGDPSVLACVGKNRAGTPPYEAVTLPWGPNGYDGQFYYVIARAPLRRQPEGVQGIDCVAARQLRILYPAACWVLSAGNARLLFWVMPALSVGALGCLAGLGAATARRYGSSVWWGVALPFAINAGMPVLRDLTEPLAMLGVFGLLSGWLLGASWWQIASWALVAVSSREQNVAIVGVVTLGALAGRRWAVALSLAGVIGAWFLLVGYLRAVYGEWPFLPSDGNLGLPFGGMAYRWSHLGGDLRYSRRTAIIQGVAMTQLVLEIAAAAYLATRPGDWVVKACMLSGALLAVLAGRYVYSDLWSYGRVFFWLPVGIWLGATQLGHTRWLALLTPACAWHLVALLDWV
jgi:hypothetical protein